MTIGGEHFFSTDLIFKKSEGYIDNLIREFSVDYHVNFTFGGYYSILAIIDSIKPTLKFDSVVLLPSYLCPSVIKPFSTRGIKYKFYRVDENLFIDIDHLISIIDDRVKAVLIIDYFGASQLDRLQLVLEIMKSRNITVIQDLVQCLQIKQNQLYGDYIFNSFRKFFPFEGSILLSKNELKINFIRRKDRYLIYKRIGQILRYFHIKYNLFPSNIFLTYLKKAEICYYDNHIFMMPRFNQRQLNKYDIQNMIDKQVYNYKLLCAAFYNMVPVLLRNRDFIPLGFVMKIEDRDSFRKQLFSKGIYPPIHWLLSDEIDKDFYQGSHKLSSSILTLPIIGLTDEKLQFLVENIKKNLNR